MPSEAQRAHTGEVSRDGKPIGTMQYRILDNGRVLPIVETASPELPRDVRLVLKLEDGKKLGFTIGQAGTLFDPPL